MPDPTQYPHSCFARVTPDLKKDFKPKDEPRRSFTSSLTANWKSGDCEMEAGSKIVFNSDGTGTFTARVKMNHTHSGDKWNVFFIARNKPGAFILREPSLGEWEGPRMDDDHGWYDWTVNFAWNQSFFDAIDHIDWYGSC